jgi:CO/xanthine dehydrogenase Mo-binding subunit
METHFIGKTVQRKEGREKVTGAAQYIDELTFSDMLHGITVRSPIARGRIRGIHFGDDCAVRKSPSLLRAPRARN